MSEPRARAPSSPGSVGGNPQTPWGSERITSVAEAVERRFKTGRRVFSFAEYLDLFHTDPVRYARDASRYLRDVFDHYGTQEVVHPWGEFTRWKLFDLPWDAEGQRGKLVGQEHVQAEIYRALSNFAREG